MIAIIPARGGSKRIPGKNIKPFLGRPIIEYSIRAAIDSECFTEVMVSTDSEEIAAIAKSAGASVPFLRSEENSNDFATTADVVREVLEGYVRMGVRFDRFAVIYPCAPFVTPELMRRGVDTLRHGYDGAFTCVEYTYPIQRALVINDLNRIVMRQPEFATARTQDLPKTFHDAGQCYFMNTAKFMETGSLWGDNTAPLVLSPLEVQDIDNDSDWKLAELKYKLIHPHGPQLGKKEKKVANLKGDFEDFFIVPYTEVSDEVSEALRQGRNNTKVRRWMIDTNLITPEQHAAFVESLKGNPDKAYYALYVRIPDEWGTPKPHLIGSVTLSKMNDSDVERGIWLFPEYHGEGYAQKFLRLLYPALKDIGFKRVFTRVLTLNNPSNALETSLGALPVTRLNIPEEFQPAADNMKYYVCAL